MLLAHGWPVGLVRGTQGAAEQCQVCLDGPLAHLGQLHWKTLCLQSTFTLSVTVAGLALVLFSVCLSRPLFGLVVVRRGGQPLHDLPLRRSFHVLGPTAALQMSKGFLVFEMSADVCGFRPVLARGWHDQLRASNLHRHRIDVDLVFTVSSSICETDRFKVVFDLR